MDQVGVASIDRDSPPSAAFAIELDRFLPYRLATLSGTISRALSRLYDREFGLSPAEWRLIAVLARATPLSANEVCDQTAMDKVQVSRAVARSVAAGLVDRTIDNQDRRRSVLRLTAKGLALYRSLAPRAIEVHDHLLGALTASEADLLFDLIDKLDERAVGLANRDPRAPRPY